mgnify:CR=1 FL=1
MSVDCDIDMINALDAIIYKIEKEIYAQAKHHDRNALSILMTAPGIGEMIALTILYEIHTIKRFPSAQKFSSYSRLVTCLPAGRNVKELQTVNPLEMGTTK